MERSSRSPSPSFDITESSYRPAANAPANSTLFQYNADSPYARERASQQHERDDDDDSVELAHLVPGKRVTAHATEVDSQLERGLPTASFRKATLKDVLSASWAFEVGCCAFALVLLAVIAVLLAIFNDKAVPEWSLDITLGTIVAILAAALTLALTVPLAAALSQTKWLWYRSEKPLADFGIVDDASRNAWGSLKLLAKRRAGFTAAFGAILMILTLAIAPFVEQTIQYDTHLINSTLSTGTLATLPTTIRYHRADTAVKGSVDLAFKAAFLNGLLGYAAEPSTFNVPVDCSTSTCGWLPYDSLAISSQCEDLSAQVSSDRLDNVTDPGSYYYKYALPDGVAIEVDAALLGQSAMTIAPIGTPDSLLVFEVVAAPLGTPTAATADPFAAGDAAAATTATPAASDINNATAVPAADEPAATATTAAPFPEDAASTIVPVAEETGAINIRQADAVGPFAARCTLSVVVQSYTGIVSNGVFTESPTSQQLLEPSTRAIHWDGNSTWTDAALTVLNATYPYGIDLDTFTALSSYLEARFTGTLRINNSTDAASEEQAQEPANEVLEATFAALTAAAPHTLDKLAASLAASLTRALRTAPSAGPAVSGTAWAERSLVHVQWAWLALPAALTLLVAVFVAIVGMASRRAGMRHPWKGSTTATLFHGLESAHERRLGSPSDMDEAARGLLVALRRDDAEDEEVKGGADGEGWSLHRASA